MTRRRMVARLWRVRWIGFVIALIILLDEAADQRALSSPSFMIEDQVADPSVSYRVKH